MILVCSRGHQFDTEMEKHNLKPGSRCPMELSWDKIAGPTYCRRTLKNITDVDVIGTEDTK